MADLFDGSWNSNGNQRTIGAVCTATTSDPVSGTYVGHGRNEDRGFPGEGAYYYFNGSCSQNDMPIYTTWVR